MELKNQILARTVENLEAELKTLQTCDNLTKLREQHENVVKNVQERHRKELFSYSEKIDEVKMKLETKVCIQTASLKRCLFMDPWTSSLCADVLYLEFSVDFVGG